jgi:hypothetical protein
MFEIEVTKPLPHLSLNDDQTGLAIVMRRKGRPVGFWLDSPAGKRTLQPAEIGQRILAEAGQTLLAEGNPGRNGTAARRDIPMRPCGPSEVVAGIPFAATAGGTPSGRLC